TKDRFMGSLATLGSGRAADSHRRLGDWQPPPVQAFPRQGVAAISRVFPPIPTSFYKSNLPEILKNAPKYGLLALDTGGSALPVDAFGGRPVISAPLLAGRLEPPAGKLLCPKDIA